jgi:hypothetical protein
MSAKPDRHQIERVALLENAHDTLEESAKRTRAIIRATSLFISANTLEELAQSVRQTEDLVRVFHASAKMHRSHYNMPDREKT